MLPMSPSLLCWLFLTIPLTTPLTLKLFCTPFDKHQMAFLKEKKTPYKMTFMVRRVQAGETSEMSAVMYINVSPVVNPLGWLVPQ